MEPHPHPEFAGHVIAEKDDASQWTDYIFANGSRIARLRAPRPAHAHPPVPLRRRRLGMTRTDREIVTSDGTPILRFRSFDTFDQIRQIAVRDGLTPVRNLNELEYVKGEIYANIWHSARIDRIDPAKSCPGSSARVYSPSGQWRNRLAPRLPGDPHPNRGEAASEMGRPGG